MKLTQLSVLLFVVALALASCGDDAVIPDSSVADAAVLDTTPDSELVPDADVVERDNPTWTAATHEKGEPNFDVVFPEDATVHRIDLTISAEHWAAMQADLDANLGGGGRPGGRPIEIDFTPIWTEATLAFNGAQWTHVGIRYKGNSTLQNAHSGNTDKYPFKLDFDEWEDTYPAIDNQRFYGFRQLNLGSNFRDDTAMREKVASDLFRAFGVPAAHASFAEVYLDRGNGPVFIGVYTLVEEVDDTVYETQFPNDEGNLYKPDGDAASFAQGTFDTGEMDLKTNDEEADYADVMNLYNIIHDPRRVSDPAAWKAELESVFDVTAFLRYLAVNQVIQNWDTYGQMTHNYFLYADDGVLTWVPWDNNESLPAGSGGGRRPLSLTLSEVSANWPIIRYILDVDAYQAQYLSFLDEFVREHFNPERMTPIYDAHQAVLQEAAGRESARFATEVAALKAQVASRVAAVDAL